MKISYQVYVPSYQRYDDTLRMIDHIEDCIYVVRESEAELYKQYGIEKIWSIQDDLIDNIHKVHDYIIKNSPEDFIVIVDDDGKFIYRTDTNRDMTPEEASAELERIAQMMVDLRIGLGLTDAIPASYYYDAEFKFKGMSGGCKWIYKKYFTAKVDPKAMYNFDLDLELQQLMDNRVVLKPNYFIDIGGMDTNKGGSNTDKTKEKRMAGIEYMKLKWGQYFDYNYNSNKAKINVKR